LLKYARDPNEHTRAWAVEGLAMLASDDTIDPLLDRFAHDTSAGVRQRAAYALAQAGMLTREQRLSAVPALLNLLDDDALDFSTRGWVYQTLRRITGAELGNNADAWREWWAHHDKEPRPHAPAIGTLRA
jgi:HEAT repeat protein